jgi:hypothetical protein
VAEMLNKTLDVLLCAVMFIGAIVALCTIPVIAEEPIETTYQVASEPTAEETTEAITEPTEIETTVTEPPVTEETIAITLYNVPLDTELQLHIIETAESYGIDPAIVLAMAFRESNYNPSAMGDNGNSYGLLQVQLRFHKERMQRLGCTDLLDPYQNVTVAVDFLASQIQRYGSLDKALVSYNRGHYAGTITNYAIEVLGKAEELRGDTYVLYGRSDS